MNTDGRRFCFKSPANASQRHHPSHHSSSWFIILKRIMIHHKHMIHSSHYSRFWNKQHIGWQDILRKRNGAQLRPASLPCRGAVVHHDYHLPTPFSHRSVSLGQTQRRWKYPRCGCVCVCQGAMTIILNHGSSTPSVYGSRAESARNMEFVHVLAKDFATMSQLPARFFFAMFSQSTCCTCFIMFWRFFFSWFPKLLGTTTHVT